MLTFKDMNYVMRPMTNATAAVNQQPKHENNAGVNGSSSANVDFSSVEFSSDGATNLHNERHENVSSQTQKHRINV